MLLSLSSSVVVGLLIAMRIIGILALIPAVAGRNVSWAMRLGLTVMLTLLVAPVCHPEIPTDVTWPFLLLAGGKELVLGGILGFGVQTLLFGVQVAGQLVSHLAGQSLSSVFDSAAGSQISSYTRFLDLVASSIFLLLGGHRLVIGALLQTFIEWPPGNAVVNESTMYMLGGLLNHSFLLGIEAALPVLATLFISNVLAGMLGRMMPHMNVLVMSGGMNSLLMMASVLVGMGVTAWTLQEHLEPMVDQLKRLCGG